MADSPPDILRLTDFVDLATLQEIQDSFAAVADVKAIITDAEGSSLTQAAPTTSFLRRQKALAEVAGEEVPQPVAEGPQRVGAVYVAPIIVNDKRVGMIRMSSNGSLGVDEAKLTNLAEKFGLEPRQVRQLVSQWLRSKNAKPAAIQFLFLLANAIARLCFQEFQLRQRINELHTVLNVAIMLAEPRDLQKVLDRTTAAVCEVMRVKATSIRLIDESRDELIPMSVCNLSPRYMQKGPIRLSKAEIDHEALGPDAFAYVKNMGTDPRIHYPQQSIEEGIVSMLSVGMRYKGKAIGVVRVYTEQEQAFSPLKIDLLKAVAAQAAAAIENARLLTETHEAETLEKQVHTAAEVQQRMMPHTPPIIPGIE